MFEETGDRAPQLKSESAVEVVLQVLSQGICFLTRRSKPKAQFENPEPYTPNPTQTKAVC